MRKAEQKIRDAISASTTWSQALKILDLHPTGANYRYLQFRANEHEICITHFAKKRRNMLWDISDEDFSDLVKNSSSIRDLIVRAGASDSNSTRRVVRKRSFALNTDHFTGQGWSNGLTADLDNRIRIRADDNILLVLNAPYWACNGKTLAPILLRRGVLHKCNECGGDNIWNGKPLTLHVDHINGIKSDNRIENLRFLCPNCHQQTSTWGSKNIGNK